MDAFLNRFNNSPETEWLESVAARLTSLSSERAFTRPMNAYRRAPGRYDRAASNVEFVPDQLVRELTEAVCLMLPDALSARWDSVAVRNPASDLVWKVADVSHKRVVDFDPDAASRGLPDWLNADMRARVDRLIEAVGSVVEASYVTIPAMEEECRSFGEDLTSSRLLTGEDPSGDRTLADLRAKVTQSLDQLSQMRRSVSEAITAYRGEIEECKNLDQAYLAAGRVAAFEPEAASPVDLDPSIIQEDAQQSRVRAIKLRSAAEQIHNQAVDAVPGHRPRRVASSGPGM